MFCPRCGRPVNEGANFCGGCGLPRTEIDRLNKEKNERMATPPVAPVEIPSVSVDELNLEIKKLENDLNGTAPVNDYTTDSTDDTNINLTAGYTWQDIKNEVKKEEPAQQSRYSYNAPKNPMYRRTETAYTPQQPAVKDENLSVVDYIWMMLISGLPVIGFFYLIWLGFIQNDNTNKQNFARATLIFALFAVLLSLIFAMGIIITQVSMFY